MALETDEAEQMRTALREEFGRLLRVHEPLARHSTFGVGGPADAWVSIESEAALQRLATLASQHGWPLLLVGRGSNILYADAGARGVVAQMALNDWKLEPLDAEHALLHVGAGAQLPWLVQQLAAQGWAGLEWAAGVPGSVGGAVVSNAGVGGVSGPCVADTLVSARVLFAPGAPDGDPEQAVIRELPASALGLGYRQSRFRAHRHITFDDEGRLQAPPRTRIGAPEMVTGATFRLQRDAPAAIRARIAQDKAQRIASQPKEHSAGSVFKNPEGDGAGRLIDSVGLKRQRIGNAMISEKHANFIVNLGGASAADVVALIALARRTVRERCGVELELEVELRGDW